MNTAALERLRIALEDHGCHVTGSGDRLKAQCPAHDDRNPSLSLTGAEGRALVYCHAGCATDDVLGELGLTVTDLFDEPRSAPRFPGKVVREYPYRNGAGSLIGTVVRSDPKTFRPSTRNGDGWKLGASDELKATPYRLPEVVAAVANGHVIYVTEGERDADSLAELGIVATCNQGGAGKWSDAHAYWLRGADVVVVRDSDPAGHRHGEHVMRTLDGVASSVRLVEPAEGCKDVTEHLTAGNSLEGLRDITTSTGAAPVELSVQTAAPSLPVVRESQTIAVAHEQHHGQLRFAERFVKEYDGQFLHVHGINWHEYDGARWAECLDGAEVRAVLAVVKQALALVPLLDKNERDALLKDISRVESAAGINGVLDLAQNMHPCTLAAAGLDADPELLNTPSGTVNLVTGEVRPPHPSDHLSKVTRASFNPDARSDELDGFLEQAQPDPEMVAFLARSLGSTLLGRVREHVLLIWHGTGANGKGTLRDTVRHALGDYAVEVPADILLLSKQGQQANAPERMRLKGARLAFCSEIANGAKLDEATMKKLTGGDPVNAKLLYRNPIEFDPSHTLIMLTNHLPQVRGDDPAVWRRLMAVPFGVVVPPDRRDGELPEKLKACGDAVLAWLWHGWLDYQRNGLNPPKAVLDATEQYRLDSDVLARFLADEDAVVDGHGSVGSAQFYRAFMDWQRAQGEDVPMSNKAFSQAMEVRGYRKRTTKSGASWQGLSLVSHDLREVS